MNYIDWILLAALAVVLFFALRKTVRRKGSCSCGSAGCSGNCSACSCGKPDCPSRKSF